MLNYKIARDDCIWKYESNSFETHEITPFGKSSVSPPGYMKQDVLVCRNCGRILGQLTDDNVSHQTENHVCKK